MNDLVLFASVAVSAFAILSLFAPFRKVSRPDAIPDDGGELIDQEPIPGWMRMLAFAIPQMAVEHRRLRRDLLRNGDYQPHALERFLAQRNARVFAAALIAAYFAVLLPEYRGLIAIIGLLAVILLYACPGLFLHRRADARVHRIMSGLPDALDILSMCLSGGVQIDDSIHHITDFANGSRPDLAAEFQIVARQSAATSPSEALNRLAARLDVPELKSLALLLLQAERLGTSVAEGFDELAATLRKSFRQKAEARANTLALQLLFPVVFCLMPPILAILLGPPLLDLKEHLGKHLAHTAINEVNRTRSRSVSQ